MNHLVPQTYKVPLEVDQPEFLLRKLTTAVVFIDYEAVMSSCENLRQVFCRNDTWPADDMTLEDNYRDLERHQNEFDKREAFAYTVLSPDKTRCLGCIYINPPKIKDYDASVFFWIRDEEKETGLETTFDNFLRSWIKDIWPFKKPIFPGRDITWTEYENLRH